MADEMEKIAARLRLRRLQLEKSLQDISDKAGITKSTLQRYEKESIRNLPHKQKKNLGNCLPRSFFRWWRLGESNISHMAYLL